MAQKKIAIIDYALGNLFNVQRAFNHFSTDTIITNKPKEVESADKLVLPGVGAFGEGMRHLKDNPGVYQTLERHGETLEKSIREMIAASGAPLSFNRVGSMMTLFFNPGPVKSWDDSSQSDKEAFAAYHKSMLERGIYMPPSQFEAFFISAAHTDEDIAATAKAIAESIG